MSERIKAREIASYSIAGMGQNMIYVLSSSFLMIFYTDVFLVNPAIVGTIFLVARAWDAINDFLMGSIVDRTRTRFGKLRPFLLFAPIPIGIITILTFTAPDLEGMLKIIYITVTYILWGMIYTIGDVPFWGLSAAMSQDSNERTKLITFARIATMVGSGGAIISIPLLIEALSNGDAARGYLLTAIIISVIGCLLFSLAFFGTKERVIPEADKSTFVESLKLLFTNKPLLIILFASVLGFSRFMAQTAGTYVTKYNLDDPKLFSVLGGVLIFSVIIAIMMTPSLLKFTSKKNLFIYTSIFGAVMYITMYFVGYSNFTLFLVFIFLSSLSMGFFNVLQSAMIADTIDYLECETGKRAEGICYASQTFFFKVSGALSAFVMGIVLSVTGYEPLVITQLDQCYDGIFSLVSLIPGIGCLLGIIPMFFYTFTEDKQKQCVALIQQRKGRVDYDEGMV